MIDTNKVIQEAFAYTKIGLFPFNHNSRFEFNINNMSDRELIVDDTEKLRGIRQTKEHPTIIISSNNSAERKILNGINKGHTILIDDYALFQVSRVIRKYVHSKNKTDSTDLHAYIISGEFIVGSWIKTDRGHMIDCEIGFYKASFKNMYSIFLTFMKMALKSDKNNYTNV